MERGRTRDDHCEHTSPTPPYIVRSPAAFPATKARGSCTLSQVPGSSPVAAFELAVPEGTVSGFAAMIAVTLIIWRLTLRCTYSVAFSVLLEQLSAEDIFHRFVLLQNTEVVRVMSLCRSSIVPNTLCAAHVGYVIYVVV